MKTVIYMRFITILAALSLALAASPLMAQVYKVVDKDGNVTFTDQPPGDGSKPIELAPISVIEAPTYEKAPEATAEDEAEEKDVALVSAQELQGFCNHFPTAGGVSLETGWPHSNCLEYAICNTGRYAGDRLRGR